MLSIDEAIAFERQQAKDKRNEHYTFGIQKSKEAAEEHEQLAEWLEELKAYREIGTVEGYKNAIECYTKEYMIRKSNVQYDKAVDDFVEDISLKISDSFIWGKIADCFKSKNINDTSDEIIVYIINTANEIAEQLKKKN